jgi:predicted membrane protein
MAMQLNAWLDFIIWAPLVGAILIVLPAWVCQAIFSDSSFKLRITFLILNILSLILVCFGSYAHNQMMITAEAPFDWDSFFKIGLILGTPLLANILMMIFLSLPSKNTPSTPNARKYSNHPSH